MYESIIFIGLGLIYACLKIYLEKRLAPLDAESDERRILDLAFVIGCNVYQLFKEAGAKWKFSEYKIDEDFKRYLREEYIPGYVRRFIREHEKAGDRTYQMLLFSGGRPPYL